MIRYTNLPYRIWKQTGSTIFMAVWGPFYIFFHAAAEPVDLFLEQSADILAGQGVLKSRAAEIKPLLRDIFYVILSAPDTTTAMRRATEIFTEWEEKQSNRTVRVTTGVTDKTGMQRFIAQMVDRWSMPWGKYFMNLHPGEYYKGLEGRVLAVYGEKDLQVDPVINAKLMQTFLAHRQPSEAQIETIPGVNHLFQHCLKCAISEYATIEETLSPQLLLLIEQWLQK